MRKWEQASEAKTGEELSSYRGSCDEKLRTFFCPPTSVC